MSIIKAFKLGYNYLKYKDDESDPEPVRAIGDIDLSIEKGEFVAILGRNGSGKSTLAKHMNALLMPTSGTIWIDGKDPTEEKDLWKLRKKAGMVFQNPDNQIIAGLVEEDVAFGPENIGVPTEEIWTRVAKALEKTGMTALRDKSPNRLSGGQKQRVAIAGIVAMQPDCIILDEPTAMLDPVGRKEVLATIRELNQREGVTIILITHYMEEVAEADRVFVMDGGNIILSGTPREVFSKADLLKAHRLNVPEETELACRLRSAGYDLPEDILTEADLLSALDGLKGPDRHFFENDVTAGREEKPDRQSSDEAEKTAEKEGKDDSPVLELDHVTYTYSVGTAYETDALKDISLKIGRGEFIGIIGHTGSGKSTLVQHLNGLIRPTKGRVLYEGEETTSPDFSLKTLRTSVGLVFQYPEYQLFETNILSDAAFGPKNKGLTREEAEARARQALLDVGISEEIFADSPFEISGGQKRRVAIAGILAMDPKVLVLDEPTAGLDPAGRDEILAMVKRLQRDRGITVLLVTHSMEDAALYADRLLVIHEGELAFDASPEEVFVHAEELETMGLSLPRAAVLSRSLKRAGWPLSGNEITIDQVEEALLSALRGKEEKAHA